MHAMALYEDHILPPLTGNITLSISHAQSARPSLVRRIATMNMMVMSTVITITPPNSHNAVMGAKHQF